MGAILLPPCVEQLDIHLQRAIAQQAIRHKEMTTSPRIDSSSVFWVAVRAAWMNSMPHLRWAAIPALLGVYER
jgi:hypothetical protein